MGIGRGNIVYDILDERGVFGTSLEAASDANRFRNPSTAPGERTSALEEQMLALERVMSERVMRALDRANLTRAERETVLGRTLAFLSEQSVAGRLGTPPPDARTCLADIDAMLAQFGAFDRERAEALREITRALDGAHHRRAA